eukprot:751388-Hanusia_phi.AAC.3
MLHGFRTVLQPGPALRLASLESHIPRRQHRNRKSSSDRWGPPLRSAGPGAPAGPHAPGG